MYETMFNIDGDEITIIESYDKVILQFENGREKDFSSYEKAIAWAYKRGFQF